MGDLGEWANNDGSAMIFDEDISYGCTRQQIDARRPKDEVNSTLGAPFEQVRDSSAWSQFISSGRTMGHFFEEAEAQVIEVSSLSIPRLISQQGVHDRSGVVTTPGLNTLGNTVVASEKRDPPDGNDMGIENLDVHFPNTPTVTPSEAPKVPTPDGFGETALESSSPISHPSLDSGQLQSADRTDLEAKDHKAVPSPCSRRSPGPTHRRSAHLDAENVLGSWQAHNPSDHLETEGSFPASISSSETPTGSFEPAVGSRRGRAADACGARQEPADAPQDSLWARPRPNDCPSRGDEGPPMMTAGELPWILQSFETETTSARPQEYPAVDQLKEMGIDLSSGRSSIGEGDAPPGDVVLASTREEETLRRIERRVAEAVEARRRLRRDELRR